MSPNEALFLAREKGVDLIEINPNVIPPLCKLIAVDKWKYEQKKSEKMQKKNNHKSELKELRLRPNTDLHDIQIKLNQAREFFVKGHSVKFTIVFSGREITHQTLGWEKMNYIIFSLVDIAVPEKPAQLEMKQLFCIMRKK